MTFSWTGIVKLRCSARAPDDACNVETIAEATNATIHRRLIMIPLPATVSSPIKPHLDRAPTRVATTPATFSVSEHDPETGPRQARNRNDHERGASNDERHAGPIDCAAYERAKQLWRHVRFLTR